MVGRPRGALVIRVVAPVGTLISGATIALSDDESHHLQVRRASDGSPVEVLDLHGTSATGTATRTGRTWSVTLDTISHHPAPPVTVMAVGAGDRDRFLHLVEMLAPLGVTRIIPLVTERTRHVATRWRPAHQERAERMAAAACKQSGAKWAPTIEVAWSVDDLVAARPSARWFLGTPHGVRFPSLALDEAIGWCIGPEGGFTEAEERVLCAGLPAQPVAVGRWTLRFEVAAALAAALTADFRRV